MIVIVVPFVITIIAVYIYQKLERAVLSIVNK